MNSILTAIILLTSLVIMVLLGQRLQRRLPDHHLSPDSKDAMKLAMGLIVTMTALLLGLLVSSAKSSYDTKSSQIIQMAAKITLLDRVLTAYGPDAAEARTRFRAAVDDTIHRMWQDEAGEGVQFIPNVEQNTLIYAAILNLLPRDDVQRGLKTQAASLAVDLAQLRMLLLAMMSHSIPRLLLIIVICWLVVIFASFGLLTPPNLTTTLALIAAAVSVASAVFLIMELDQPMGGVIRISSEPMLNALNQFTN
jgi:hypothetical protein